MDDPNRPDGLGALEPGTVAPEGPFASGPARSPGLEAPLPHRPQRHRSRPSRALPLLLLVIAVLGFGAMGLFAITSFLLTSSSPSALIGGFSLRKRSLALLRIEGVIAPGPQYEFWMSSLETIAEDDDIQGLILRIDSPGGSVGTSQELYDEVLRLRHEYGKTVYVSMGDVAASGGYYIAVAADRVFANRGSLTGSVGVIATMYQFHDLAEEWGIGLEVIKSGRFKDSGSMFRPMNSDERQMFDLLITDAYDQFVADILAQRGDVLDEAAKNFDQWQEYLFEPLADPTAESFLLQIADGRVYSGSQAKTLGLIDDLGSLNATIRTLAEELGLPEDTEVYEPHLRSPGLFELLTSRVDGFLPGVRSHPSLQYRMLPF